MRPIVVVVLLTIFLLAIPEESESQLVLGTNGLKLPPINLLTVYRILRRAWRMLTTSRQKVKKKGREVEEGSPSFTPSDIETPSQSDEVKNYHIINTSSQSNKVKVKFSCANSINGCNKVSLKELMEEIEINGTRKGNFLIDKENITSNVENKEDKKGKTIPNGLSGVSVDKTIISSDIISSDLLISSTKSSLKSEDSPELKTNSTILDKETKTLTFSLLPFPFNVGGWIASYIALNGVLLGLYIFLAAPYFLTGKTVRRIVDSEEIELENMMDVEEMIEEPVTLASMDTTGSEDDNIETNWDGSQYIGYTTYGKKDTFEDKRKKVKEKEKEEEILNDSQYLGYTSYGENDMFFRYLLSDAEDDNVVSNRGEQNIEEDETECVQNVLCLHPVYGERALSATSLVVKFLNWIMNDSEFGKRFKRNEGRFQEAIEYGRQNNCQVYVCKR